MHRQVPKLDCSDLKVVKASLIPTFALLEIWGNDSRRINLIGIQCLLLQAFDGIVNVTNSLMSADTAIVEDAQRRSNASEKYDSNISLIALQRLRVKYL